MEGTHFSSEIGDPMTEGDPLKGEALGEAAGELLTDSTGVGQVGATEKLLR